MRLRSVQNVLESVPRPKGGQLPAPPYEHSEARSDSVPVYVGLAVEGMRHHMTDEGWQLFQGLESAGCTLHGFQIGPGWTDVPLILSQTNPDVVVVQDQREWEGMTADRRQDKRVRFRRAEALRHRPDVFTVTVLKDAQNNPPYHEASAAGMGAHAWIVYYHPAVVAHVAPYLRPPHLVRTYHTVDRALVPPYRDRGRGCLLSGAVSNAYPLRQRIFKQVERLPESTLLLHPGYHQRGCATPRFLQTLSQYRVALCTSSVYGYALRKIIEATACGCRVITDLPTDEVLPEIDGNLIRVSPDVSVEELGTVITQALALYNPTLQAEWAARTCAWYDYRYQGARLVEAIERLRSHYP